MVFLIDSERKAKTPLGKMLRKVRTKRPCTALTYPEKMFLMKLERKEKHLPVLLHTDLHKWQLDK